MTVSYLAQATSFDDYMVGDYIPAVELIGWAEDESWRILWARIKLKK